MHHRRLSGSIARRRKTWPIAFLWLLHAPGCTALRESGCDEIISASSDSNLQSRVHQSKGVHLVEKGKLDHAATAFERAIASDNTNGAAHNNLGLVYLQQRQLSKAAVEFDVASQLMPENPTPLNNLGMTLEAAGKGFEALDYYHQAYDLDPSNPLYLGNLVRTRIRLGDNDESLVAQLKELRFIETRPDWLEWIDDQLALNMNPYLDRGPAPANFNNKAGESDSNQSTDQQASTADSEAEPQETDPAHSESTLPGEYELGETILVDPMDGMVEVELLEPTEPDPVD